MALILNGSEGLSDVDGSASTPAIRGTDTNTGIFFPAADTIAFSEGGVESMRIDSAGNVGIGTSSPTTKLQTYNAGASLQALFEGTSLSPYIQVKANSGSTLLGNESTAGWVGTFGSQALAIKTNDVERMRIDSSGNLLVGTTSQPASGPAAASNLRGMYINSTQNGLAVKTLGGASSWECFAGIRNGNDGAVATWWYNESTLVGRIAITSSATSYITSSDYRLKENIAPMTGALGKVAQLKPVTYTWKADGSDGQGFIAHELAEVCPDAVVGEKDAVNEDGSINPQGIDTSFLVATLTAAIQELKAEFDEYKATHP
jgi:hypothetical protein